MPFRPVVTFWLIAMGCAHASPPRATADPADPAPADPADIETAHGGVVICPVFVKLIGVGLAIGRLLGVPIIFHF